MRFRTHARSSARSGRALATASLVLAAGCAGAMNRTHHLGELGANGGGVNGENYTDVLRALDESRPTPAQRPLRDAVARYEVTRGMERLNDGDLDGAVRALRVALVHYTPEELGQGGLPRELGTLAHGIADVAAPRGDEAHTMAAYRVLSLIAPPDPRAPARFQQVLDWGDRNRREFRSPWVYRGQMAEIYKEIARVVPAPDVLSRASEYLIGRYSSAMSARMPGPGSNERFTLEDLQQRQAAQHNTPVDLAILYLRIGDLQAAADQMTRASEGHGENETAGALRAIAHGEGGADDMFALVQRLGQVDPAAQAGVCRRARQQYPADSRFAQCLAIAAAREGDMGLASAHLEAAVQLSPTDAEVLRAAIEMSADWLQSELGNEDPAPGRRAYQRTRTLLDLWARRGTHEAPPVTVSELEDVAAQLELGQANLPAAQQHLERATQAQPASRDAFLTLAEIAWRHHDDRRAIAVLDQGLALPLRPNESDSTFRPAFLLRQGLAARSAGDAALAHEKLTQAVTALDALTRSLEGAEQANAYFFHAVAADALGQSDVVRRDLDAAVNAAPDSRELAARAITFALARGRWADAHELIDGARARLQLDRTWQVYFALWGVIAARMGHFDSDGGAADALATIAQGATEHSPWTVRLAQRYHGSLDRDGLLRHAQTNGQRAEAAFYEGMLALAANDLAGAERDLRAVVASDLLRFFEYDMAWEMLARGLPAIRNAANATTATPSTPPPSAAGTAAANVPQAH